jgi:signal peptidase I
MATPSFSTCATIAADIRAPGVGDLIAFHWPQRPTNFSVGRVVAVSGDRVAMREGQLIVNGTEVAEPYIDTGFRSKYPQNLAEVEVPEGELFVLNDRRDLGPDSRHHGNLPVANVLARAAVALHADGTHENFPTH